MEIRDTRNGSWYWVNTAVNACKHISAYDKCVYGALASFSGCKEIRPSFEEIARRSGISLRQTKLSIKSLVKVGYVGIVKGGGRGRANVYDLLKCAKGCRLCTVYKGCKSSKETVHIKSINRAGCALQLDKEVDKNKKEAFNKNQEEIQKIRKHFNWPVKEPNLLT